MLKLLFMLLILIRSIPAERDTTPVFIMDFDKILSHVEVNPNPLAKLKSNEFAKIVEEAEKRSKVVVLFIEDSFCFEDISLKDKHGTPYYHLGLALRDDRVKFIPAVSQPFKIIKKYFQQELYNTFYINDSTNKFKIYDSNLKFFYIYFKDYVNETRAMALRRHDLLMREVYSVIQQSSKPIIAIYTGKINPIIVEKMNFVPVKPQKTYKQPGVVIESGGALFKFIGVYSTVGTRRSSFSQIPMITDETWATRRLSTRMAYSDFEFEFTFIFKEDRWLIDKVLLLEWGEEVGSTELRVGAPWNWSYMCSDPLVLINLRDGSSVTISHYQVQPFISEHEPIVGRAANHSFGPPIHCGPYFNAQILACLMVSFICLGILFYGVVTMYNCHSNDRYDDQNQKPLVIAMEGGGH